MADHIENEGKKGKFLMWFIIYFLTFMVLVLYLYHVNDKMVFN